MSQAKLIRQNGFSQQQGKEFFAAYHKANPYVRATMQQAAKEAQELGYITTVLGRRVWFRLWEPIDSRDRKPALPEEQARLTYGSRIKRAHDHKAINYRLQGSAAEQIKAGMVQAWRAGVFDVTGVPRLQVHDELDFSVPEPTPIVEQAFAELRHILETAIPTKVPILVDESRGKSWDCE